MNLVPYSADLRDLWDDIVHFSRNGTFLLHRDYMDYIGTELKMLPSYASRIREES